MAVSRAFAALRHKLRILRFTDEQLQRVNCEYDLWTPYLLPANTYPTQTDAVRTIVQPNFLTVRKGVDPEVVYLITKTIYENLPFLNNIHKATTALELQKAVAGLPMPLHPGAVRYYQEVELDLPAGLIAK